MRTRRGSSARSTKSGRTPIPRSQSTASEPAGRRTRHGFTIFLPQGLVSLTARTPAPCRFVYEMLRQIVTPVNGDRVYRAAPCHASHIVDPNVSPPCYGSWPPNLRRRLLGGT